MLGRRATAGCARLGWATLVANIGIVVTGGAVRLTGSGLGCPTWPRCTDESFTPHGALDLHAAIEFGNRMLTFVLAAIAVATFVSAWQSGRRDLRVLALWLGLGIPAQAVIGGITVLTDLNPWVVSFHLLCSLAIIGLAVLYLRRDRPRPRRRAARRARRVGPRLDRRSPSPGWCSTSAPSSPAPARTPATRRRRATGSTRSRSPSCTRTSVFLLRRPDDRSAVRAACIRGPAAATRDACCSCVELAQGTDRVRAVLHRPARRAGRLPPARRRADLRGSTWVLLAVLAGPCSAPVRPRGGGLTVMECAPLQQRRQGGPMLRTASRRGCLAVVVATLLLTSGCGEQRATRRSSPLEPDVPADLCATVPAQLREGLIANANNSDHRQPDRCLLAALSRRRQDQGARRGHLGPAQRRRAPPTRSSTASAAPSTAQSTSMQAGFSAEGAERACAGSGTVEGADSATMAALTDREVITVRLDDEPAGKQPAMPRGKQMLEGVLASMAGNSSSRHERRPGGSLAPADVGPGPARSRTAVHPAGAVLRPVLRGRRGRGGRDAAPRPRARPPRPASSDTRWSSSRSGGPG